MRQELLKRIAEIIGSRATVLANVEDPKQLKLIVDGFDVADFVVTNEVFDEYRNAAVLNVASGESQYAPTFEFPSTPEKEYSGLTRLARSLTYLAEQRAEKAKRKVQRSQVYAAIASELTKLGIEVDAELKTKNGADYSSLLEVESNAVIVRPGWPGRYLKNRYPRRADGSFSYSKIAAKIQERIVMREAHAKTEQTVAANRRTAEAVAKRTGLVGWSGVQLDPTTSAAKPISVAIKTSILATPQQAEELLLALAKLGICKLEKKEEAA